MARASFLGAVRASCVAVGPGQQVDRILLQEVVSARRGHDNGGNRLAVRRLYRMGRSLSTFFLTTCSMASTHRGGLVESVVPSHWFNPWDHWIEHFHCGGASSSRSSEPVPPSSMASCRGAATPRRSEHRYRHRRWGWVSRRLSEISRPQLLPITQSHEEGTERLRVAGGLCC